FGLPGASIYVQKAGRGTSTNEFGYFSMPILAGDTVTVSMIGFKKYHMYIPANYSRDSYSVIIELKEDPTLLPVVDVFPYATEEVFKEAFLALRLPTKDKTNAEKNLDEQLLRRIFSNMPMDGAQNQMWAQQQYSRQQEARGTVPSNPLLNPFAWADLINSIKRGDFKKQKGKDYDDR
ncbi:MAG: carboxypeptidase-like regulatory domain-containing protein, partial [Chitinophagaceae bacterium]